jgi:hypothetical protein
MSGYVVGLGLVLASCITVRPEPTVSAGPPTAFQPSLTIPASPEPVEVAALSTMIHASGGSCVVARLGVGTAIAGAEPVESEAPEESSAVSDDQAASAEDVASDDDQGEEVIDEAFLERLLTGPPQEPVEEQIAEDESVIVPPSAEELENLVSDEETVGESAEEADVEEDDGEVAVADEEEEGEEESIESVRS